MKTITQSMRDLIYLISCAVTNKKPNKELVEKMDFSEIYSSSKFHNIRAMSYIAIHSAFDGKLPEDELFKKWKEDKDKSVRKSVLFDLEYLKVSSFLEKNKIWYMPLKGTLIKKLYPQTGMREMSDIDILFDGEFSDEVCSFFVKDGYSVNIDQGYHYEFLKPPVYNVEMHNFLFSREQKELHDYYLNVKEKLIKYPDKNFAYGFSDSDMYIYIILHEYKHYYIGGTGLRSLTDCYLVDKRMGEKVDREYISNEFEKLGINDFYKSFLSLSYKLLDDPKGSNIDLLTEDELMQLNYIFSSGTYGTMSNEIMNQLVNYSKDSKSLSKAKRKYVFRRFFPDMLFIQEHHPFVAKHKVLLPFFYIYRIVKGAVCNLPKLFKEAKIIKKL